MVLSIQKRGQNTRNSQRNTAHQKAQNDPNIRSVQNDPNIEDRILKFKFEMFLPMLKTSNLVSEQGSLSKFEMYTV